MNRTFAFIQARMSSSRFPGKVLKPVRDQPLIVYMAQRVLRARALSGVVVLTSTDASDDALAAAVAAASVPVHRGDLDDVLKRFRTAAEYFEADHIVRLTGDCPLIDPSIIDAVVQALSAASAEYASNVEPPTYPDGLDVECFTRDALDRADRLATRPAEREHVTLWMRSEAAALRRVNVTAVADFAHLRLTVDYPDDLEIVRRIAAQEPVAGDFDLFDILRVMSENPDMLARDRHKRNEGLSKPSLQS
jgi:spore coat polysaccharide biosynthesis protein SpsF (cytidylyltransferase family)